MIINGTEYIPGADRSPREESDKRRTHLYRGAFDTIEGPMCLWGWNRDYGTSLSIWRNNISVRGLCRICVRRATKGLDTAPPRSEDEADALMRQFA